MDLEPLNDQDFVESLFDNFVAMVSEKDVRDLMPWEQKRDILIASGLKIEIKDEDHARISFMFYTINVDSSGTTPAITMEIDFNALMALAAKKA